MRTRLPRRRNWSTPGHRRPDVGQCDQPWVMLTDPKCHEFQVLTPR
ncbi:hypothetical protein [Kutzneria sp. NPDC051319]